LTIRKTTQVGDYWNYWWREQFENYSAIPKRLDSAIELGCGPYTNMRLILLDRCIDYVVCSDPLAREYIKFKGQWLAEQHAKGKIVLDWSRAEKSPFASSFFDLVVMINVLDHVQDAHACLATAIRLTKPGGYFVFGQDLSNKENIERVYIPEKVGEDIGHPIRLQQSDLDPILMPVFEPILYKILSREESRAPNAHYGTYLFIGRKREK